MSGPGEITCRELVELVTDYLEGALPAAQRTRFEEHLVMCAPCGRYMEQMRQTRRAARTLTEETIDDEARDALLGAFREWKRE
jgi:anti-sigma factor RsiW